MRDTQKFNYLELRAFSSASSAPEVWNSLSMRLPERMWLSVQAYFQTKLEDLPFFFFFFFLYWGLILSDTTVHHLFFLSLSLSAMSMLLQHELFFAPYKSTSSSNCQIIRCKGTYGLYIYCVFPIYICFLASRTKSSDLCRTDHYFLRYWYQWTRRNRWTDKTHTH